MTASVENVIAQAAVQGEEQLPSGGLPGLAHALGISFGGHGGGHGSGHGTEPGAAHGEAPAGEHGVAPEAYPEPEGGHGDVPAPEALPADLPPPTTH
jgi:hypothetical protein